jgi:hypothetical protein
MKENCTTKITIKEYRRKEVAMLITKGEGPYI